VNRSKSSQVTAERRSTYYPPKRYLSDIEVEALYGIRRKTLQNWRILGRGPIYKKFGSGVRYDVAALEAWIDSLPQGGAGVPASAVK
jgi:predicted DNA-binding transcriptional regulator AlpA